MKNFFLVSSVFLFSVRAMEESSTQKSIFKRITDRALNWFTHRRLPLLAGQAPDAPEENNVEEPFEPFINCNHPLNRNENEAIKNQQLAAKVQELIDAKGNLNNVYTPYHFPLLYEAVNHDSRLEITKKLLDNGAHPNIEIKIFRSNNSPICRALTYGAFATAQELVFRGANVKDQLLLHEIVRQDSLIDKNWSEEILALVKLLIEAGIDPNEKDSDQNTCMYSLITDRKERMMPKQKLLCLAHRKALMKILLDNGLEPGSKNNYGRTALEHAQFHESDFFCAELTAFLKPYAGKQKIS